MACIVVIDGVPVVTQRGSISIDKRIEERNTASFTVVDEAASATYVRGQPVDIIIPWFLPPFHIKLFQGFIDTPGRVRIAPGSGLYHEITCMDNHYLADKRLVVKAYANKTLGYIVTDIYNTYLAAEGITVGAIQAGPTIKSAIFNYAKVSEAFDALKELSGFTWYIDEIKYLYFIDRSTYAAPWDLDGVTHRAIKDSARLTTGNPLYRNHQYIRGSTGITSVQTENFTGDGVVKSFSLGYPLALEPDITENSVVKTVGIKGVEIGKDYYWNKGDNTITATVAPAGGVDVEVVYYGQYPLITLTVHPGGAAARAAIEGGTGIVEDIVTEAQHESAEAINESAEAKLVLYCQEAEKFIYRTTENGIEPGQLQAITYAPFGFAAHDMLIESVRIIPEGETIYYDISAITGPVMGSWARFFSGIFTKQDRTIQVGDSVLLVLQQEEETLALVETPARYDDDFSGGLINRWIALPPAQGKGYNIEHELLELAEVATDDSHDTEDYHWDDADAFWDFATWS